MRRSSPVGNSNPKIQSIVALSPFLLESYDWFWLKLVESTLRIFASYGRISVAGIRFRDRRMPAENVGKASLSNTCVVLMAFYVTEFFPIHFARNDLIDCTLMLFFMANSTAWAEALVPTAMAALPRLGLFFKESISLSSVNKVTIPLPEILIKWRQQLTTCEKRLKDAQSKENKSN